MNKILHYNNESYMVGHNFYTFFLFFFVFISHVFCFLLLCDVVLLLMIN